MYGGETDDDMDDMPQENGSLVNGVNGYEESGFQSLVSECYHPEGSFFIIVLLHVCILYIVLILTKERC